MSHIKSILVIFVLLSALLVACGGAAEVTGTATPPAETTEEPTLDNSEGPEGAEGSDAIAATVVAFLAQELGVAEDQIEATEVVDVEFSDSCLGLGGPAESCLQAMTPGWLVLLDVNGAPYEVHTDETGQQIRIAPALPEESDVPADMAADTAAAAAQEFVAAELDVALGDVQVVSVEPTEFNDGCLGFGRPDESCIQVITPGWIVILDVGGQTYEAHTDETGQQVRLAPSM